VDPRLNARREKFKNATQLFQSTSDERRGTENRLGTIEKTLQEALLLREKSRVALDSLILKKVRQV